MEQYINCISKQFWREHYNNNNICCCFCVSPYIFICIWNQIHVKLICLKWFSKQPPVLIKYIWTSVSFFCGQNKIPQVKINSLMLPIANGLCDNLCFVCSSLIFDYIHNILLSIQIWYTYKCIQKEKKIQQPKRIKSMKYTIALNCLWILVYINYIKSIFADKFLFYYFCGITKWTSKDKKTLKKSMKI